jgi:hypothetical protein
VKVEEGCPSGDYVYDLRTGKALYAVDRWAGLSAGTDLLRRVERVQSERMEYLAAARGIPLLLLLAGGVFMAASLSSAPRSRVAA